MRSRLTLLAGAGALVLSSSTLAAIEVIFSEAPGHPTASVPAGTGLPKNAEFELFDRPFRSHNGQRFILQAQALGVPDTEDRIVMVFDGTSWSTVLREGQQAPWTANPETMGIFDVLMGINDDGDFCFVNNTSAASPGDDYAVAFDASSGTYSVLAQEGQPIPDASGNTFGATQDSAHVLSDGTYAFYSTANAGGARLFRNDTIIAQATVTVPGNQANGGTETYSSFTSASYGSSADGAHYIVRGNLNGDTTVDEVVAVDNVVVLREGQLIAGMDNPINTAFGFVLMMSNGDWFVRGSTATDNEDYIVRNGSLIARTGQPIFTGATELYDDTVFAACFFWMQGNNNGDWVIGGVTDAANADANAVLVLNGEQVLVREGDPVDLNGNGKADDDAFVSVFNDNDGFLTDDALYFTADLRDATLTGIGQAFLRIPLGKPEPCVGDTNNSGAVDVDDLIAIILAWGECTNCPATPCPTDTNGDCATDVDDLITVILNWGACN